MAEYIVNIDEDLGDFDFIAVESLRAQIPLIRCRDCKWYKAFYTWDGNKCKVCVKEPSKPVRNYYDYCSRAERKDPNTHEC